MSRLTGYEWKGNVRELQNIIERACALADGPEITAEQLPPEIIRSGSRACSVPDEVPEHGMDLESTLDGLEKDFLLKALEKTGGAKMEAARLLGLSFPSFRHRLKKYGIE